MNKKLRNMLMALLILTLFLVVSGCTEKESASDEEKMEETETKADKKTDNPNKEIQDFVLENTKLVKVISINQRIDQQSPDLGPFDVVRGIDQRGQKSEIWIKDMKIYKMIESDSNQNQPTNNTNEENAESQGK